MQRASSHTFDRTNAVLAVLVWLVSLVVFTLTKAPTLSLWDCGEFIAASAILGVPHPPGSPLYVVLARVFSLLPFFSDISVRINFLSSFSSSLAVLFAYLSGVRLLRPWLGTDRTAYGRTLMYAGAAAGAFLLAFGRTAWSNAVEAEVYGLSMMLTLVIFWLTLIFYEKRQTLVRHRIMLAVVYLAFLGIGVHMSTFLIFPVGALLFIMKPETPTRMWGLLAGLFGMELYLIFALSSRPGEVPLSVPLLIVLLVYLFYVLSFEQIPRPLLIIAAELGVACLPIVGSLQEHLATTMNFIGGVGLVALLVTVILYLKRFLPHRTGQSSVRSQVLTACSFVGIALFMFIILVLNIRGYAAFLFISVLLFAAVSVVVWRYVHLPLLIAMVGLSLIIIGIWPFVIGALFAAGLLIVIGLTARMPGWRTALLVLVMAVIGFSSHLFIPIRSAQQPFINENNPSSSLAATINFLERKQYGSQGMVERMFKRRAEWKNQFGVFRHMGFWGYFEEQYGINGKRFFIVLILGLFGLWEIIRRRPPAGLFLMILIVLSSVGLVLYMNFADGTRMTSDGRDYLEVRNRDYFFTPAFMMFGLAIGLGLSALVQFIRESITKLSRPVRHAILSLSLIVFLIPALTLGANWHDSDRSRNRIPYEYAWDLLMSADPNAVLFTNGDNDTFPLWAMQEAYRVRKDVRIVNLSLANTKWYIKQLKSFMHLKLGWSDKQIDELRSYRYPDGRTFRVQDQVIDAIINHNPGVPINFSVTVGGSARKYDGRQIDSTLELSGLMFRFDKNRTRLSIAAEECLDFFLDSSRFVYSGLADRSIHRDEASRRVIGNVVNSLLMAGEGLREQKNYEGAKEIMRLAMRIQPESGRVLGSLTGVFADLGQLDSIDAIRERYPHADPREMSLALARAYRRHDQPEKAFTLLDKLLIDTPSFRPAFDEMMRLLVKAKDPQRMVTVLQRWVRNNPKDQRMRRALNDLLSQLNQAARESAAGK